MLEDAHWSDSTTLELLDRAIARPRIGDGSFIVTARPDYQPQWVGRANVTHLRLGRLDRGEAERICANLGAEAVLPAATVRQIVDALRRHSAVRGGDDQIGARGDGGRPRRGTEWRRSRSQCRCRISLVARLDRLGPARRVANLGAAIGRRFSYELLAAVATQPDAELRQGLRDLTSSGLVESSGLPPTSSYQFKHVLIRDAAYKSLLRQERQMLHGKIAAVLRDRFPETREAEPELLAYHFTESGAIPEAIPLWATAGQRAASRAAHVEAVRHLQTALDLLRRQPDG